MATTAEVLAERGERYGKFDMHAEITQFVKQFFRGEDLSPASIQCGTRWQAMSYDQRECVEMIAHKLGRIFNGDPNYGDSWRDIAGYATLVADRLENVPEKLPTELPKPALQAGAWALQTDSM